MSNITTASFRANAHLLKLLGDQLIGDDRLAVFELVKNAYDADATIVDVQLNLNADILNSVIRKAIKKRKLFPTDDSARKVV